MSDDRQVEPSERRLANLGVVWRFAGRYPGRIAVAFFALVAASLATVGIPYMFRQVIDRGFAAGGTPATIAPYFWKLLAVMAVMWPRRGTRTRPAFRMPAAVSRSACSVISGSRVPPTTSVGAVISASRAIG